MKKVDVAAGAAAALFAALALVGVLLGRDWKLLLVPLALLPALKTFATCSKTGGRLPGVIPAPAVAAVQEIVFAMVATTVAFVLSARLATGRCPWSAGAMTSAVSAISAIRPINGCLRCRAFFVFCMLAASTFYAVAAFATSGSVEATGFGAVFVFPGFAVARSWLAVRDWRKGAAA
jgi:hypothetical protein